MRIPTGLAAAWIVLSVVSNSSSQEAVAGWSNWGSWVETCQQTCGSDVRGIKFRERNCTTTTRCTGESFQTRESVCSVTACPGDNWTFWEAWRLTCSATCGDSVTGIKSRTRACNGTSGTGCQGPYNQTEVTQCNVTACTVNGSRNVAFQTPLLASLIVTNHLACYVGRY